jgi:lysine 2,3-aminomutase
VKPSHPEPVPPANWDDWRWQVRNTKKDLAELEHVLHLTSEERRGVQALAKSGLPLSITPYYLSLCDPKDPNCPIRRQVVPREAELAQGHRELRDPLGEESHEVAPRLIRRYPDRVLYLFNDLCATYCRFCTRKRRVGHPDPNRSADDWARVVAYLRATPEVRELIVSGGDPLYGSSKRLMEFLRAVRTVPNLEVIRLATRVPVTLPQRITDSLVGALRTVRPLYVMTHFNHPKELTREATTACRRLVEAGIPVMNQTVLMRGINDQAVTLAALFRGLVRECVHPYYLLLADPAPGTAHFRTPVETGLRVMEELQGRLSGLAVPKLILDAPGGFGKVPLLPEYVVSRGNGVTRVRTYRGVEVDYFDPDGG